MSKRFNRFHLMAIVFSAVGIIGIVCLFYFWLQLARA